MKTLEIAKELSTSETPKNFYDSKLQSCDLDYETIHSELLENLIIDENDSGISDFEGSDSENDFENDREKYFQTTKIKTIIQKSVKNFFDECQEDDQFKPLLQQQNNINENNKEKINEPEQNNLISTSIEMVTEEKNNEISVENKSKVEEKEKINNCDENFEKEKEIVNYKKYNFYNDPFSNYNMYTKNYQFEKNSQKRLKDIHPFLKTFNPKFLKKENIDKKIFRRFRKYVRKLYKTNSNAQIFSGNKEFWEIFYFKNLLPPVKITTKNKVEINHKSFSNQYLIWLFNQEGISTLFKNFVNDEKENVITNFVVEYNLENSSEKDIIGKLEKYLDYIPDIYETKEINKKEKMSEDKKETETTNLLSNTYEMEDDEEDKIMNPFTINFDDYIEKKQFKEENYENYYDDGILRFPWISRDKIFQNNDCGFREKGEINNLGYNRYINRLD